MALRYHNVEWLNGNSQRKYPLADDATSRDVSGSFRLPKDFLVSLYLGIHSGNNTNPANFYIKSIGVFSTGFSIIIGYAGTSVASALIPRTGHERFTAYRLGGLNDFVDCMGHVVISDFDNIDEQPPGQWEFGLTQGRLELDCIRPFIRGVSALRTRSGSDLSERIYGDIILRAGKNMRITPIVQAGEDPVIQFDAIEGEGLNEECICEGADIGPCIRTINGIKPTPDGDFTMLGSQCLEVNPITHGVQVRNPCSEPCCGCDELETVTEALEMFGRQAATLEMFINSLESRVTQMDQVVLGSKLGDRACNVCEEEA